MNAIEPRPAGRNASGRFARGNPGRPPGARGLASRRVSDAILRDFEANQDELLPRLRRWFLPQYLSLVGRLLPRPGEAAGDDGALDEAEAARLIEGARAALARIDAGEGSLDDLEAALAGLGAAAGGP